MYSLYDQKAGVYGYGNTEEEAEHELEFNILRADISRSPEWIARRNARHSWCPTKNSLHLDGVTAVVANNGTLTNTKTGKSVVLKDEPLAQFTTLYYILGENISFEDFCITYASAIDDFLRGLAPSMGSLKDFPAIRPGSLSTMTYVHYVGSKLVVGESEDNSVVSITDYKKSYAIEMPMGVSKINVVAYVLAKMGLRYNGEEII